MPSADSTWASAALVRSGRIPTDPKAAGCATAIERIRSAKSRSAGSGSFLVLDDDVRLVIEGAEHPAPAGTLARLDPEPRRTMRNPGDERATVLIASAPVTSGYEPMEWA